MPIDRIIPYLGRNLFLPANALGPEYCQEALNVTLKDGTIRKRDGTTKLAPDEVYPVLGLFDFQFSNDLSRNLCKMTNLDFKVYDAGADAWVKRTPRTTEGNVNVLTPNIVDKNTGTAWTASDVRVGDRFFTTSGTGSGTEYRVASVTIGGGAQNLGRITIEPNWNGAFPTNPVTYQIDQLFNGGLDAGQGINPTLGGNLHQLYSATVFSDTLAVGSYQDFLIFSNGADGLFSWQAAPTLQPAAVKISSANAFPSRYVEAFAGRVFSAFTLEGGISIPQRLRHSVFNNHRDWTSTGSGFRDLADTPDEIANIKTLSTVLAIYKRTSIYHGIATGLVLDPLREQLRVENKGLLAPFSLASFGDFHMLMSQDGIYRHSPGEFRRFEAAVDAYKEIRARINYNRLNKVFGFANTFENEYWLAIPVGTSDNNNVVYVFSLREGKNFFVNSSHAINYATMFRGGTIRTWSGYTTGTVTVTNGSTTVTGAGTSWTTAMVGRKFHVESGQTGVSGGGVEYTIASVASATSLTLTAAWTGSTSAGVSYGISDYGTWDQQSGTWDEQEPVGAPIAVFGTQTGLVTKVDPLSLSDRGSNIEVRVTLRADQLAEVVKRSLRDKLKTVTRLIVTVKFGSPFTLEVWASTSQGVDWQLRSINTITEPPAGTVAGAFMDVYVDFVLTGRDITLRFLNTSSNEQFEIVSYRIEAIEAGKAAA
jgi:hypothetical protein